MLSKFDKVSFAVSIAIVLPVAVGIIWLDAMSGMWKSDLAAMVGIGALIIIIAMQGLDLLKTKNSTGVSIKMFAFFIGFQAVFAINGYRLGDPWQMWGMILSIVSTSWVLFLTIRYRKPNNSNPS